MKKAFFRGIRITPIFFDICELYEIMKTVWRLRFYVIAV